MKGGAPVTITTILDLAGALLLVLAAGLFTGIVWGIPAGLAVAGALLLALSWLIDRLRTPRRKGGDL